MVVGLMTVAGVRFAARQLQADLRETARVTAVAVADSIELGPEQITGTAVVPVLSDFMNAARDLYAISVFRADSGVAVPVVSTSIVPPTPRGLMEQVIATGQQYVSDATPDLTQIGVPISRDGVTVGGVVVAVSLAGVARLERIAGLIGAGGAVLAIGVLTLIIHLLARRLVLVPLREIRRTIGAAQQGHLHARATLQRHDELREVADGLNRMLEALEGLHRTLNGRVEAATETLRQRNAQLVRSYESVLQLRDAAGRAQQLAAIGQTAANMAHQIGTPLNLVSGHVQLLLQEIDDDAPRRRLLIVQEQVERVATTVRELLKRGGSKPERLPTDVGAMLSRLTEAMRLRIEATGVTPELHIAPGLPLILADETQLELAVLNLVTNALDAMVGGGTLAIAAEQRGGVVRITVRDTGSGIDPELIPQVFEPWVTTKAAGCGAGLGLSITRDVIASLGGTIEISSVPGEGATVTIDIPCLLAAVKE
jgi:signal transduction histidine kinase